MAQHKVAFLALAKTDVTLVEQGLAGLDYELSVHVCGSDGEAIEAAKGADIIIAYGVRIPREVVETAETAKAILSPGHGFDHIDHDAATDNGIMVVNSAGFGSEEVANHAIMLLLACAKKMTMLHNLVRAGEWKQGMGERMGVMPPIYGQVLGLIAVGNIGRATARKAKAFGLEVIAYDPYLPPWVATEYAVEMVPSLTELASRSDYVSMHTPLNDETRKMIGESFFKAMKPSAYFINTGRGGPVDEEALTKALQNGEIAGAGLDVFEQEPTAPDNPLLTMDNVIVTPHSAGFSDDAIVASLSRLGQETARILRGTWPMSLANPEVRAKIPARPPAVIR